MSEEVKDAPAGNQEVDNTDSEPQCKKPKVDNGSTDAAAPEESNNVAAELENTELLGKIKKQIEYYFGDNNMRRDKFLLEQTRLDEGWVPLTVLLTFKSLAALSKNAEVVVKAIEDSDLMEIAEDKKKIRRSLDKPLPTYDDEYLKAQEARTIYLKGFPTTLTIQDLKDQYDSEEFENIIMRKYTKDKQKFFKGSIFLQFKNLEKAEEFMKQEEVKYKDTVLIKKWAKDYNSEKEKEKEEKNAKKLKTLVENEMKESKKNEKEEARSKKNFLKGCVMHLSNIPAEFSRDYIKEKISELSEVAYIDHKTGDAQGWIRFQGENSAVELYKKLEDHKIKIDESEIDCKLLEGEEEDAYFVKVQEDMNNHKANRNFKGRRGGGRRHLKRRGGNQNREENGKRSRMS